MKFLHGLSVILALYFSVPAQAFPINQPLGGKTISNVSNHAYSTVVSPFSSLAVISGNQGADLVDYEKGELITRLDITGAANSAIFVKQGDTEILYVMAFTNFPGYDITNGVYGFILKDGKPIKRLDYNPGTGMKGSVFPVTSFSLSATEKGDYVYFVSLETTKADDQYSNGKRWLNRISVNPDKMDVTAIPMPDWYGWPGYGGDDGVAVTPDGSSAWLPHSLVTYKVVDPSSDTPKVSKLKTDGGDGALTSNDGKLFAFDYGDVYSYGLDNLKKATVFNQSGDQESFIENAQLYDNGQKLLITLQDISAVSRPAPLQFYLDYRKHEKRKAETFFLPNKVLSIDLKTGHQSTLYRHFPFTSGYPTSAAVSHDGQYLLVTVWHEKENEYTDLHIYSLKEYLKQPNGVL
ncbi:hypothetical protein [Endozoicomonas arenosclerae]|uniref:hypothetical protein n=1 Tax=Endozoicomonas arenosclerae TaxID=1633495 RepID=UPI0007854197|nr:hypothetical protein [Endozoicomonas arenosclerae]